ncbi:AraC family transcriptional regulator [Vogesella alkaliphila]|uniref:Transcriptional regulator n=1 Tax=Vogesella alkaliphila TaxID=1193621 RepID=A0ABQ2YKV2_9NEIS|nr:AraC family transcriptional regulator [Vogesella alkaliphila]GGX86299.1 transcriptional regulator [Vogesella alkaliphila]
MSAVPAEYARYFRADDIAPLECLDAFYTRQVFTPHFHEEYVVNALTLGAQSYRYHGSSHVAGVGALVLINPGEVHTGESADAAGWGYRGFYPSATLIRGLASQLAGRPVEPFFRQTVIYDVDLAQRLALLQPLLAQCHDRLQRESALYAVFADVLQRHMGVREQLVARDQSRLQQVRALLADRLADNLSLQQLADSVGLSPWHLNRSFRAEFGLPPVAWRNQLRVARARQLLAQGVVPGQVAAQLGFADQPHLTRAFRAALGVTPAAYQRAVRR